MLQAWLICPRRNPIEGCPARSLESELMVVVVVMVPLMLLLMFLFDGVLMFLRRDRVLVRMLVPIRMMLIDPVGVMVVPPVAIMPFVMFVEVAVASPIRMILGPFWMVRVHPAAIVLMPPVRLMPIVVRPVGAPSVVVR